MTEEIKTDESLAEGGALTETEKKKTEKKAAKPRSRKKKERKEIPVGLAHIHATYNNTIVTITDPAGNVLSWSSAGLKGFRGPKKATPYAASVIVKDVVEKVHPYKMREVSVLIKGIGAGRDAAIRALYANNLNVLSIKDATPIPHNGCRPPKVRRV
ncbi:MAG: 30S ribosomal protein S11 [Candidatus Magasanikbacteria bacterium]|nr:30S ribosomal protein S11 [Candidatus Magasanikbacteria bacterium]